MGCSRADVSGADDADFGTSHCSSPFQIFRGRDYELVARVFNPCRVARLVALRHGLKSRATRTRTVTFSESADITLCLLTQETHSWRIACFDGSSAVSFFFLWFKPRA